MEISYFIYVKYEVRSVIESNSNGVNFNLLYKHALKFINHKNSNKSERVRPNQYNEFRQEVTFYHSNMQEFISRRFQKFWKEKNIKDYEKTYLPYYLGGQLLWQRIDKVEMKSKKEKGENHQLMLEALNH